jgi:hypothetical protein
MRCTENGFVIGDSMNFSWGQEHPNKPHCEATPTSMDSGAYPTTPTPRRLRVPAEPINLTPQPQRAAGLSCWAGDP